jgi:hypothetical protein
MTDTTVWKFPLDAASEQTVAVPGVWVRGLSTGVDPITDDVVVWVMILPVRGGEPTQRRILVRGTGQAIDSTTPATFIGTAITDMDAWHVFDGGQA